MSRISIKLVAAAVLACFTLVTTADVSACCHHRRRCGGGGCGYGGGCGSGGCGGGYCYSGYGKGGYYAGMPAPLFPRLAFATRGRAVARPVVVMPVGPTAIAVRSNVIQPQSSVATQNLVSASAGTPNAITHDGGGNE